MIVRGRLREEMRRGSTAAASARGHDAGFTLLELVVTLTLAASIAALLLPGFSRGLDRLHAAAAVRSFASCLRQARYTAIVQARVVAVALAQDEADEPRAFVCEDDWRDPRVELRIAGEPGPPAADAQVLFYPWGGSSGGELELMAAGRRFGVLIDWFSGSVRVRG